MTAGDSRAPRTLGIQFLTTLLLNDGAEETAVVCQDLRVPVTKALKEGCGLLDVGEE